MTLKSIPEDVSKMFWKITVSVMLCMGSLGGHFEVGTTPLNVWVNCVKRFYLLYSHTTDLDLVKKKKELLQNLPCHFLYVLMYAFLLLKLWCVVTRAIFPPFECPPFNFWTFLSEGENETQFLLLEVTVLIPQFQEDFRFPFSLYHPRCLAYAIATKTKSVAFLECY